MNIINPLDLYARATARLPLTPGERAALKVWDQLVLSAAGGAGVEIVKALLTGSTPLTLPALAQVGEYAFVIALLTGLAKLFRANGDAASLALADAADQAEARIAQNAPPAAEPVAAAAMNPAMTAAALMNDGATRPVPTPPPPTPPSAATAPLGPIQRRTMSLDVGLESAAGTLSDAIATVRASQAAPLAGTVLRMPKPSDAPPAAPVNAPVTPAIEPLREPQAVPVVTVPAAPFPAVPTPPPPPTVPAAQASLAKGASLPSGSIPRVPAGANEPPELDKDATIPNIPAFLVQ